MNEKACTSILPILSPVSHPLSERCGFPMIMTSGVGGKVVYYAAPLESFFAPDRPKKYYLFLENMYTGLLGFNSIYDK